MQNCCLFAKKTAVNCAVDNAKAVNCPTYVNNEVYKVA